MNVGMGINYEGQKFSKSNSIGIFGDQVANLSQELEINEDYWRFYLLKIRPESHDSSFDWNEFIITCNSDLVNNIGNYINRCVSMTNKFLDGHVTYKANEKLKEIMKFIEAYNESFEDFRYIKAVISCLELGYYGNQFLQENAPWKVAKSLPDSKGELENILGSACIICYVLCRLLLPIIPNTAGRVLKIFGFEEKYNNFEDIINNNNKITLNTVGYVLPFKPLDKDIVIGTLKKLNIKTCLENK